MSGRTVANEFAKMRRLGVGPVAGVLLAAVVALSVLSAVSAEVPAAGGWNVLLAGMSLAFPLASPLLIAVLASRQVDIEHQSNGWLFSATAGPTPGDLCRGKFVALGTVVGVVTVASSLLILVGGLVLRPSVGVPIAQWAGFTACMLVINLVVAAFHVMFSAKVDNQLVGLGVGVLGTVVALFAQGLPDVIAHVTPWGYYALAQAADYRGAEIVSIPPSYPSIAALAVLAGATFVLITARFDRQEV